MKTFQLGVATKTWRVVAISGNHNYPSDSRQTLECITSDTGKKRGLGIAPQPS